jgi:hypothetical protein
MRREHLIGEADIGEIGADRMGDGVEDDRTPGQRERLTRRRG